MATRYIGDAKITITYRDRGDYAGRISAGGYSWAFSDLHPPAMGFSFAYDSPEAYDKMAMSAAAFGSYYTTHNRGDDTPDWAPPPEVADAIDDAVSSGDVFEVRRTAAPKSRDQNPGMPRWSNYLGTR